MKDDLLSVSMPNRDFSLGRDGIGLAFDLKLQIVRSNRGVSPATPWKK
jgi:hypothetical protein